MNKGDSFQLYSFFITSGNEWGGFIPALLLFYHKLEWMRGIHSSFTPFLSQAGMNEGLSFQLYTFSITSGNEWEGFIPPFHLFYHKREWMRGFHSSFTPFLSQAGMNERDSFQLYLFLVTSGNEWEGFIPALQLFHHKREWIRGIHSTFSPFSSQAGMNEGDSFHLFTFFITSGNEWEGFIPPLLLFHHKREWMKGIHSSFTPFSSQAGMNEGLSFHLFTFFITSGNECRLINSSFECICLFWMVTFI